jgi:hypothetical protein
MKDKATNRPMFHSIQIQLACAACIADNKTAQCQHMLHLMPRWQSSERMIRLQTIMEDRPDLVESELSGVAANTLQSAFRSSDIDVMFEQAALPSRHAEPIFLVIDPAAGGPQSDYAMVSFTRVKGMIQVCFSSTSFLRCTNTPVWWRSKSFPMFRTRCVASWGQRRRVDFGKSRARACHQMRPH